MNYFCPDYPLILEINQQYIKKEMRFQYYGLYSVHFQRDNHIENEQEKTFNKAIKYNDTIVIGDINFHNLIKRMNLPCKNIYYLNIYDIPTFFQNPKKIKNTDYNICKYFFIINEKIGIEYLETIKYIGNVFCFRIVVIIYVQNKNIKIDKKILQTPFMPIILTYSDKDILNYFNDNYDRLKEMQIKYINHNELIEKLQN